MSVPFAFWKQEAPAPTGNLRILLSGTDLTGTGPSELWQDQDLTDGQDNSPTIDWTYDPTPFPQVAFVTDHIEGQANSYHIPAMPADPIGPKEFTTEVEASVSTAATGGYSPIISVAFTDTSNLSLRLKSAAGPITQFYLECFYDPGNPFTSVVSTSETVAQNTLSTYGMDVRDLGATFEVDLTVNGVVEQTLVVPTTLKEIADVAVCPGGGNTVGLTNTEIDLYGFSFYTAP